MDPGDYNSEGDIGLYKQKNNRLQNMPNKRGRCHNTSGKRMLGTWTSRVP